MKVKVNENQFDLIIKNKLHEALNDQIGSVELDKNQATNPSIVKKFTDQGINVKPIDENILDETLGDEQETFLRHKLSGKKLDIFCTRDKVSTREVLNYITNIDDQNGVEKAFKEGKVTLYVKKPSSGRYEELGNFESNALDTFKGILTNKNETPSDSIELNEEFFAE